MNHLIAFSEEQDGAGVEHSVLPVPDPTLAISGDSVRVPDKMPYILGAGFMSAATTLTSAKIESPSLRSLIIPKYEPIKNAVLWGNRPCVQMNPDNPIPLVANEGLEAIINSDAAAAVREYGLIWFCDGKQAIAAGQIFSVRATSAISLAIGKWVEGPLTFESTLPYGEYAVVGFRTRGANLVASRIFFIEGTFRPGAPAVNAIGEDDAQIFRRGNLGQLGVFNSTTPPSVECLGLTDTSQVHLLDLIKL